MLEGSKEIEGVNPTEETNSDNLTDNSATSSTTNNGLTPAEGKESCIKLSEEVPQAKIFDDIKQEINGVYFILKEDLQLLASKRDKFMLMSQKINDVHFHDVIKLNVGGHVFQTSLQNLKKYPESTLAAMFSENFDLAKGDDGAYFIDRDGTHFRHILNFLRSENGPSDRVVEASAEELIGEAEFFGLGHLVEIIKGSSTERKGEENQSKANEIQSPERNDLETTINEHCQQTQAIIDEIKLKLERGHSALQNSFEILQESKTEYLDITKKIETVHFPDVVKLNIGGQIFETNAKTLQKDPDSLLASMFSKQIEVIKQENGTYFIDRDGTNFGPVLNYLRTGKIPQKIIQDFGEELFEEALFYNIKGMVESITSSNKRVKINVGGSTFETTTETLKKYPCSKLAEMLGKGNETYFIDRNGRLFEHVLNYLRTGNLPQKIIQDFGKELLEEALFYNIKGIVNCIKRVVKINVGGSIFEATFDTLMKYPSSRLAQMLHEEVGGVEYLHGTYYINHSNKHFGDLLKAMEIEDADLLSLVTSKVLNEAHFYKVNFFEKYASGGLFLSKILQSHESHQKQLLEWLKKEDQPDSMKLVYSAELDGWNAEDFHKNCNGISPTLVLMESKHGNIFGGYTTKPWPSDHVCLIDEDSFIFQLAVKPTETTFKTHWNNSAIFCGEFSGPRFVCASGSSYSRVLNIYNRPNVNWCYCDNLDNYTTEEELILSNKTLAGDQKFQLTKMEVFQIE